MPLLGLTAPFPFPPPSRLPNLRPTNPISSPNEPSLESRSHRTHVQRGVSSQEWARLLSRRILSLPDPALVAHLLDHTEITPTELSHVVRQVGKSNWRRALESFERLTFQRRHVPGPDLISAMLSVLGRARQDSLAEEIFLRYQSNTDSEPTVHVYNAMMGVYARTGQFTKVEKLLESLLDHGLEPDLITFNTFINAKAKSGNLNPGFSQELISMILNFGLTPDTVTFNTLISACSKNSNLEDAMKVFDEMIMLNCQPDLWTYNAMINMYGKNGRLDLALDLFNDMKIKGCEPDVVTYTTLVDLLGKTGRVSEAGWIMTQMGQDGLKPSVRTFNALICGYARAGMIIEAEQTFDYMVKSGVKPDKLVYFVILDLILRTNCEIKKIMGFYRSMVKDGFGLDQGLYKLMLKFLLRAKQEDYMQEVIKDMKNVSNLSLSVICDIVLKAKCYIQGAELLKKAVLQGYEPKSEVLSLLLSEFEKLGNSKEGIYFQEFIREHVPSSDILISESNIIKLCKNKQIKLAMEEYKKLRLLGFRPFSKNIILYKYLISCCEEFGFLNEASQFYSDMSFIGIKPSQEIYKYLINIYCKLNYPETAEHLMHQYTLNNISVNIIIIETYGKLKNWQKAEEFIEKLILNEKNLDIKIWNALITAYAQSGFYEKARAVFNQMMKNGPFPSVDSVNGLINALIVDKRFDEIYVVIQELQDMNFKINKSTVCLMLDAFVKEKNIFEVKKIYNGMKAAGYLPNIDSYRGMVALFCEYKKVGDVELIVDEMEINEFKPDIIIYNSLIKMYNKLGEYKKALEAYRIILKAGLKLNEDIYNTLIIMFSRNMMPKEGLNLLKNMRKLGFDPKIYSYKSLLAACVKSKLLEQSEMIFEDIRLKNYKDRLVYHLMLKMYKNLGNYKKAENFLNVMKQDGLEPNNATMNILMKLNQPKESENILNNLKVSGVEVNSLTYSTVIDAYLKNKEYNIAVEKLSELKRDKIEIDYRIWTIFIRASGFCEKIVESFLLLYALRDTGFDLPIRLLKEKSGALVSDVANLFEKLVLIEDNAAFNFVNAILDLLWAFEQRGTASWVFQLAIKKKIYQPNVFRVEEKDWGADFRKMSGGAALVALTLWLDHMQDASLQGSPESPRSIILTTGGAEYNQVSLFKTLKAYLNEMGSPFISFKSQTGILVAKGHSLKMWLKESSFCMDLELKDASALPNLNSMRLIEGCFMRAGLVPAFREIEERLGQIRAKKFARLALLSEEVRGEVITKDIEGRREKMEKRTEKGGGGFRKRRLNSKFTRRK